MKGITLLVVDDIKMNRDLVKKIFEEEYHVLEAKDGEEAMKIIESISVEIVITDIFMEPMNGYELIRTLRSMDAYKSIPIIAITESNQASRKKALKAGADDLIYHPFIRSILHNRVKGLLFDGFDLNRYKLAYENNPIPFVLYHVIDRPDTPSYKILYMNRRARDTFSPPFKEFTLKTDEHPKYRDFLLKTLRSGEEAQEVFFDSNCEKWIDWTVYPDGTGLVAAMLHDITDEINAQTKVSEQAVKEVKEKSNALNEIVNNMPGGIFVFEISKDDIVVIDANVSGCELLDIDREKVIGVHKETILSFVHPDDVDEVSMAMMKIMIPNTSVKYKCRIINRKLGRYIWFSAEARSKLQPDGRVFAFINYSDITAEKELKETKTELSSVMRANAAKTEFLSRMSHDMRTPMNGILGVAKLSKDETDVTVLKENIAKIEDSGEYLLRLINDTLDFQRIESGKLQLHPEIVNCQDILKSIVEMVTPAIENKKIDFKILNKNVVLDWYILVDPVRMKQIFVNLLSNAIKFTPEGGCIEVEYECKERVGMYSRDRFCIKDTGIGMSEDFIKNKIFQPFSQENNEVTGLYAGSGLGLSIVKRLVELMDGSIEVESELGVGTMFIVDIDFKRVDDAEVKAKQKQKQRSKLDVSSELKNKNILLVEDHPLNAEIAKKLLEKTECIVTWVKNGQEAIDTFQNSKINEYDVILMDIRMPVLNGLDATKGIRKLNREDATTVPIVAMTANAYEEDREKSFEVGMNDHISKPIHPREVYETIAKVLEGGKRL